MNMAGDIQRIGSREAAPVIDVFRHFAQERETCQRIFAIEVLGRSLVVMAYVPYR
jgi:hypothetical protein